MMSSFGSSVIRFVYLDLDPVVPFCISEPSSRGSSIRLGPFLNRRELYDIKPKLKFLTLVFHYVCDYFLFLLISLTKRK